MLNTYIILYFTILIKIYNLVGDRDLMNNPVNYKYGSHPFD